MHSNGYSVYKTNSVSYASKEQLLLMLVEGAVKFTKIARQAIIDKDITKAHENLKKSQNIFIELMISLDVSKAEWTAPLLHIYEFIKNKLVEANLKKKVEIIDEVLPLIESVSKLWHDTYEKAKKQ